MFAGETILDAGGRYTHCPGLLPQGTGPDPPAPQVSSQRGGRDEENSANRHGSTVERRRWPAHGDAQPDPKTEIVAFENDFNAALAHNDVPALQRALSGDWSIVSGDGRIITRKAFLEVIASGDLKHSAMSSSEPAYDDDGVFATLERIETAGLSVRQFSYGAEAKRFVIALHPSIRCSVSLFFGWGAAGHPFVASRKQENL
jgi:hypothetical protein